MSLTEKQEKIQYRSTVVGTVLSVIFALISVILTIMLMGAKTEIKDMNTLQDRLLNFNLEAEESIRILSAQSVKQDMMIKDLSNLYRETVLFSNKLSVQINYLGRSEKARLTESENRVRLEVSDLQQFLSAFEARDLQLQYDHPANFQVVVIAGMQTAERIAYYKDLSKIMSSFIQNAIVLSDSTLFNTWNTFYGYLNSYADSANNPVPKSLFHLNPQNNPLPRREDAGKPLEMREAAVFIAQKNEVWSQTNEKLRSMNKSYAVKRKSIW